MPKYQDQAKYLKKNCCGYLNIGSPLHYKMYKQDYRLVNKAVTYKLHKAIVAEFLNQVWHYILTENWVFTAPASMGQFYVKVVETANSKYTDWIETRKQGKVVKRYNFHTNGKQFKIIWAKVLFKNPRKSLYSFKACRGGVFNNTNYIGQRGLAKWIKKCAEDPKMSNFEGNIH